MSDQQQSPPNRYQRGKTVINGNTKHDGNLRYIDLIGSKIIMLLRLPAVSFGIYQIVEWYLRHH